METIIKYNRLKNTNNRGQNNVTIINNGSGGSSSSDIDFSNIDNYLHWKKSIGQFSLVPRESYNQADGDNSIAIGEYTQTVNNGELAIGMYNKPESGETCFTIGNGTDDVNRSNLFSVGSANTVVNNHLSGKTAYFSTNIISPTVSGTNTVFDTGVFYSGITSNSAIIDNISGDTVVLSQSLTAPTISGNSILGNNISGTNASITSLTATAITSNTINVTNKLTTNQLEAVSGYIKTLLSDEITVDYLTVTKAAHFFKLLIDEIKATQGQIIITPCNAVIDKVETVSGNYRCYFRAKDDDREIYNNFEVNDQVVCQTFNVATGVSYDVSNTYYWRLCVATGTTSTTIDGETVECHYIDLSNTDKDSYSNSAPAKGDNVVQLGNRNDTTRQAAIIISAYNQQFLDPTIKAPSIVQYQGINDYSLQNHRKNVISKDFNEFVGKFKTSTGDDIEELIEDVTSGITAYLHTAWANSADGSLDFTKNPNGGSYSYVGFCSNNTQSDTNLVYSDYSWSYVKGADGTNGTDGVDGISITGVTEYYLISSSSANVTTATTGWQTTFIAPTPQKKYLWNYEENHFSDGTTVKTIPVIIGNYATDGTNGTNGTDGEDGRGISSITEYYLATSASGNVTTATTGWSTTVQKMTSTNKYLWNYELITYTDNTTSKTEPVIIGVYGDKGNKGDSGTSVTITATSITYAVTTASTQPNDSEFTYNSIPSLSNGDFLWCKTVVNYSNGTTTKSYSVSRIGADGTNGTNGTNGTDGVDSYLHIAYSYSSDGSSGFSTTYFNGALYIGTCTNSTQSDPQTYTSYTWARLKGEKGDNGTSVTITETSITYAVTTANTQPADSAFTATTVPTVPKGSYLWAKTVVTYSDSTVTKTYSVSYKGTDGDKGDTGDDAEFYRLVPVIEKAIVDKNGTLGVQFSYQIAHVSGSSVTTVTATTSGYWIRVEPNNSSNYYYLSTNTTTPNYTNASFITNYHKQTSKPTYFTVYLVYGYSAVVKDQKTVSVIFDAGATLEVTDEINATVQGHSETISSHTNSIATLNTNYNAITTTVQSNTNNISNISGTVTSHTNSISQLQQTSSSLTSTVSAHTNQINSISGTVTGHTSQISTIQQNLTGITSTVSSIEDTVDNLSVGGTNLIRETKYLDTDYCTVHGSRTNYGYQNFTYAYKYLDSSVDDYIDVLAWNEKLTLEPNTWYTLSFYAKGNGEINSFLYPDAVASGYNSSNYTTTSGDGNIETTYTNTWKRYWVTWKTSSSVSGTKSLLIARLSSGYVYIAAPKFEKGTMATDWSPHPEDFESSIKEISGTVTSHTSSISQLQQTSSSLTSTVSSHTQSISQLQQTSTSLTSTVQSLQNTVSQIELTKKVTVDATSLSESYCYPVVISFLRSNSSKPIRCNVSRTLINSYGVPSYGTHSDGFSIDLDWTTKASGWGTNRVNDYWSTSDDTRYISDYKLHWVTYNGINNNPLTPIVGSIGQVTQASEEIVYVRGGSKYDISTSFSNATITLYSDGYTWTNGEYSVNRPVISYSSLVIPVQDARTYSEIVQTATNIEFNVYDELKNKTGINVSAGTITLDADNTTIVGNLNLTDTNNGLTMYDNESVPRVNIQPTKIGTYEIGKYGWYSVSKTESGHSNFYLDLKSVSLGSISSGYDIAIYYADINMWATSGSSTIYPNSYPKLRTRIYCNGTLVKDFGYSGVTLSSSGIFYVNTPMIYTTKSAGTYDVKFTLSSTTTVNTSYSVYGMVNANIQWDLKAQTQIFTDGMLSQSAPNNYMVVNPNKVEMRQGTLGLRLISDTNNPSGNMFKGIQTIVGFRGTTPDVYPTWLPFHNFTPTFSCGDGKRKFTYQYITNIAVYRYAYQISPYNDYGMMIINSPAYDSSLNIQETWVMLPPLNFIGENGTNNQLPVGYTVTIINNTFGDNAANVFVVPSVSSKSTGIIIDAHRDTQYYSTLNGTQTCDTYIYVGTWSNGTNNIMYWRSVHDTQ